MRKIVAVTLLMLSNFAIQGQVNKANQTAQQSRVASIPFKNIGPSVMNGRVVALSVNPTDPTEFYVAYASGGVWHSTDNGISFTPIMDNTPTQNIGEIAMHWPTRTLWVGTGENNASRSSYAGIGLFKTTDNGKTWEQKGLIDSHHIGKILIDPKDPSHVVVGVTGHLYTNSTRGVYVTQDGGAIWKQTLNINDTTGIIDMAHDPNDFNTQFATAWQKDRKAWNFEGAGNASGIYKSTDAGQTWNLISTTESGFPTGDGVGRIGIAVYDNNTIYAIHDSQFRRPKEDKKKTEGLTKEDFKTITTADFLSLDNKRLDNYLKQNGFQEKYRAQNVKNLVRDGSVKPIDLATYLEDANSMLFDTPVVGAEVFKSIDGGMTWAKTHKGYLDAVYYSYGYYFGHIHVAPYNADKIYIYGVPLLSSDDGGKNFFNIGSSAVVHSDHHALWIDPNKPGHLINGNDGGVNITYDDGAHWIKNNSTAVGQFYAITVDNETPYNVYGGLQDNGVWKGSHSIKDDTAWHATGHNAWTRILGGDGMYVQVDNRNSNIVYTGFQFGNYYRLDLAKKRSKRIQPKHVLGEAPYRFNWQSPILLSQHNQDILYFGGNKLHRSLNQGDDWETISPDLTTGGKKGNVAYGTLATISESPFQFGLLYTGSDDGLVYRSDNAGGTWEVISDNFPKDLWVSRVIASAHDKDLVYVTLNGYRSDDFTPYVFKSKDRGKSWTAIASNLPNSPVNVLREDPENKNILYLGNDKGVYISFNQGNTWEAFSKGLTAAAVHDIVVQSKAKHLVVGTHGRSIYIGDISKIQKVTPELLEKSLHLFELEKVRHSQYWGQKRSPWSKPRTPEVSATIYTINKAAYTLRVKDKEGIVLYQNSGTLSHGFNQLNYDLSVDKNGEKNLVKRYKKKPLDVADNNVIYLSKGTYSFEITTTNGKQQTPLILN